MGIGSSTVVGGRQVYIFKVKDGVWTWTCDHRKGAERTKLKTANNWEYYAGYDWDWAPTFEELLTSPKLKQALDEFGLESPRMI